MCEETHYFSVLFITVNTMYLSFIIISAPFVPDCVLFCSNVNNKWMRPLFLACLSPNIVALAINEREGRYLDARGASLGVTGPILQQC